MKELTAKEKARISSKAQAEAHKVLRERHKEEYRDVYREAKKQMLGMDDDAEAVTASAEAPEAEETATEAL